MILKKHNWIAGTLELSSKVRYGMTSRGVPMFRFVPYDKRFSPLAVGCSQRELFYNIHAIVEPSQEEPRTSIELRKGIIIQNLGRPSKESEVQLLLNTYARDSRKELRKFPPLPPLPLPLPPLPLPLAFDNEDKQVQRTFLEGYTFHIDPSGCLDVDDTFTIVKNSTKKESSWTIAINIADVDATVPSNTPLDLHAKELASTFYSPEGQAEAPMFPRELSEEILSLLPSSGPKKTVSLTFDFDFDSKEISNIRWLLTETRAFASFTYDSADLCKSDEMIVLQMVAAHLTGKEFPDSHECVAALMIFYNKEAGKVVSQAGSGILRRHKKGNKLPENLPQIINVPEYLWFEAAEYCLPTTETTWHFGLGTEKYAYASSPIRRYADLVNQRVIKALLTNAEIPGVSQDLVDNLNRREKQAKAFSRDYFFMTALSTNNQTKQVEGSVISVDENKKKMKIWVPAWKRIITCKTLEPLEPGSIVGINWYSNKDMARWKDKIVFQVHY